MLGVERRGLKGTSEMFGWLDASNITYTTCKFMKNRAVEQSREEMLERCVDIIKSGDIKPDMGIIERYMERFKNEEGKYAHSSESEVHMIIWNSSSYWNDNI